jgi:hypothetical protein
MSESLRDALLAHKLVVSLAVMKWVQLLPMDKPHCLEHQDHSIRRRGREMCEITCYASKVSRIKGTIAVNLQIPPIRVVALA